MPNTEPHRRDRQADMQSCGTHIFPLSSPPYRLGTGPRAGSLLLVLEGNLCDQLPALAVHLVREALMAKGHMSGGSWSLSVPHTRVSS